MSFAEIILAIFFPPIAVLLRYGLRGKFFVNVLLTILGWLPGMIHAFLVLRREKYMRRV